MSILYSNFFAPVVLPITAVTLFTVPAAPISILLRGGRVRFTNTTAGPVTVTAYAVPPTGIAAGGNSFVAGKTIGANDYLDVDIPVLPAGASLQALASAATSIATHMISGSYFA